MILKGRQIAIGNDQTVSAVVAYPEPFKPGSATAVILAHGAGSDMNTPFMAAVQEGLAARGAVAVKFNFPYKERGGRAPDPAPVLEACYRAVVAAIRADRSIAPRLIVIVVQ